MSDKYQYIRPLGSGNNSTVYLVRHLPLDQERAIKISPKTDANSIHLLSEAKILKSLSHPGIPKVFDVEEDDNNYYLIEEFVEGQSIQNLLLHQPVISPTSFFDFARQLCDIFSYLHTRFPHPLLYQDLKPEHVFLCGDTIKLVDFSVHFSQKDTAYDGNITSGIYGNQEFSAPEVLQKAPPTIASDIYTFANFLSSSANRWVACLELNNTHAFHHLADSKKAVATHKFGIDFYPNCTIDSYSILLKENYDVYVIDFGVLNQNTAKEFIRCDVCLVLGYISPWNRNAYWEWIQKCLNATINIHHKKEIIFLGNLARQEDIRSFTHKFGYQPIPVPFIENPFHLSSDKWKFIERILGRKELYTTISNFYE